MTRHLRYLPHLSPELQALLRQEGLEDGDTLVLAKRPPLNEQTLLKLVTEGIAQGRSLQRIREQILTDYEREDDRTLRKRISALRKKGLLSPKPRGSRVRGPGGTSRKKPRGNRH